MSHGLSLLAAFFRWSMLRSLEAAFNTYLPLLLLSDATYLAGFSEAQREGLGLLFLRGDELVQHHSRKDRR